MSERASASAACFVKQRTLHLAFAKHPFARCGDACRLQRGRCVVPPQPAASRPAICLKSWARAGPKGLSLWSRFCASRNGGGARRSALQWCKGERRPFLWGGRGVRERCSRVEGGLSPKALAKPPSTREAGRAARRFPPRCAGSTSSRAGLRPARHLCARRPQAPPACTCTGGKSCGNGVTAGQATTRSSPA